MAISSAAEPTYQTIVLALLVALGALRALRTALELLEEKRKG